MVAFAYLGIFVIIKSIHQKRSRTILVFFFWYLGRTQLRLLKTSPNYKITILSHGNVP